MNVGVYYMVAVVASTCVCCHAAKILAIFPSQSRSHIISFTALTTELARRGHDVTVVSTYPQTERIANYTDIAVPYLFDDVGKDDLTIDDVANGSIFRWMTLLVQLTPRFCNGFLSHPEVQHLMRRDKGSFELIIMEMFMTECFLGFAHRFDVPVIGMFSQVSPHYLTDIMGSPSPYAYVPEPLTGFSDRMTLKERVINTIIASVIKFGRKIFVLPYHNMLMKNYFAFMENIPSVEELMKKICLMFLNSDVSYNYPRPFLQNVIEVGGMHIKPRKQLPKPLQEFLDEAINGAVYFSFGSTITVHHMNKFLRSSILYTFYNLNHRVVIQWDEPMIKKPAHVMGAKWLPQSDILAHPNVRVFVSHGGALSIQEATYWGVPVVGIPIFADEAQNIRATELSGYGLQLDINNITYDTLTWSIETVLNTTSYLENAKRVSAIFRDQPTSPLERAVYWTEYVLRHKGAPHLQSAARDLTWYQYFLLDGIALIVLMSLPFYCAGGYLLFVLYRMPRVIAMRQDIWNRIITKIRSRSSNAVIKEVNVTVERDADLIQKKEN